MGRKPTKPFDRENGKCRNYEFILYPDTTSYDCEEVLGKLEEYFSKKWAYILHNQDINEDGTHKKDHIHFYGARDGAVTIKTVANMSGVPENDIRNIGDWDGAMKYAIHLYETDQYLYSADDVVSNFDYKKHVKSKRDDDNDAQTIYRYILDQNVMSKTKLLDWVFAHGYWAAYRRAASTWSDLIWENKQRMYARYHVDEDFSQDAVNAVNRSIFSPISDNEPVPFEQLVL